MTTYEKFKASTMVCLGLFLLTASVAVWRLTETSAATLERLNSTLATTEATMNSARETLDTVALQTTRTLATVQNTTATVGAEATRTLHTANGTVSKAGASLDGVTAALASVNRPCGLGHSCGTLADVNKTLATVRGTFGQIEVAANHEDRNLGILDAQEAQLYNDFHTTTVDLNALLASPDVTRFLKGSADTSQQVAGIAADVHKEADALTAPKPWYTKLGAYGSTGVNVACLVTHSCPF